MSVDAGTTRLALHVIHEEHNAAFAVHGRWQLPEHYGEIATEYEQLRSHAVAYDRSDRTRLMVSGTDAGVVLGAVFGESASELEEARAVRAATLDGDGRITDLVLIARTGGIAYVVIGEPGRGGGTLARLEAATRPGFDIGIEDRTATTCLIGIAGPGAAQVAAEQLNEALPARLPAMHATPFEFHGFRALAVRTSGLGEDGFELMVAPQVAEHLIGLLGGAAVPLAGFGAQEIARIEAGIPAFSPDLETGLTPAEADLTTALGLPPAAPAKVLSALLFENTTMPAVGTPALAGEAVVGELRSGARSFALDAAVGIAVLDQEESQPGTEITVGGELALVAQKPLYRRRKT